MEEGRKKGRPVGSGRWGRKTRVTRVPAQITDVQLQGMYELCELLSEFVLEPSPYVEGSVRDKVFCQCQDELATLMSVVGLDVSPIIGEYLGVPPLHREGVADECR